MNHSQTALIAAAAASEATTELLRFSREGPAGWTAFSDIEVVEKLAEALCLAIDIQNAITDPSEHGPEYLDGVERLRAACSTFIEGWVS